MPGVGSTSQTYGQSPSVTILTSPRWSPAGIVRRLPARRRRHRAKGLPGHTALRWFPAATATLAAPCSSCFRARVADLDRALIREPAVVVLVVHDLAPFPEPSGQPVWLSPALWIMAAFANVAAELRKQSVVAVSCATVLPRIGARQRRPRCRERTESRHFSRAHGSAWPRGPDDCALDVPPGWAGRNTGRY